MRGVFLLITVPPVGDFKTKWPQLARITHYFFLLSLDTTGLLYSGFQFSVLLGFPSVQTNESLDVFVSCPSVTRAIQTQLGCTPLSSHSLSSLQIKHRKSHNFHPEPEGRMTIDFELGV